MLILHIPKSPLGDSINYVPWDIFFVKCNVNVISFMMFGVLLTPMTQLESWAQGLLIPCGLHSPPGVLPCLSHCSYYLEGGGSRSSPGCFHNNSRPGPSCLYPLPLSPVLPWGQLPLLITPSCTYFGLWIPPST